MAINYPNFPKLNASDIGGFGGFDLGAAIKSGLENYKSFQENKALPEQLKRKAYAENLANKINDVNYQYLPRNLENKAIASELSNAIKKPYAENASRAFEADMGNQESTANLSRENAYKQKILNEFLREREPAEINEVNARANYYKSGGSGGSTGSKDYLNYANGVATDNPNLNPQQLQEAIDVISKGGTTLQDGTQLNPMSIGTRLAFDRAVKSTTTANQINSANSANQAEAELDVLNDYANKWIKPYGTTYFGKSPQQIFDTFKNDNKSQEKLGKLIAANTLQYEIAQIRNRVAAGQPGITATHEIMREAQQYINSSWPRLTEKARNVASDSINKAIKEGLAARNRQGVGAGNTFTRQFNPAPSASPTVSAPEGSIGLYKNGQLYYIPPNKVDEALSEGFTYE